MTGSLSPRVSPICCTILSLLPLLIAQGISFKIILDTGNIKTEIQKSYGIEDKFIHEIPIPSAFVGKMKGSGIEDLFSKADFKNVLQASNQPIDASYDLVSNSFYVKDLPKRLIAHTFYEGGKTRKPDEFEADTLSNFQHVLDFCKEDLWARI